MEASDASEEQIAAARPHPRVRYTVAPAEAPALTDASVDAVVVAQALHWFDFARFYAAVRRVARPGAPVVAVSYGLARIAPEIDREVDAFYRGEIDPYWPADRQHVESGYRTIPWPFDPIPLVLPPMRARWRLDDLLAYLGTWSAVRRYLAAGHDNPLPTLRGRLERAWGGEVEREVEWPLHYLAGRAK